MDELEKRLREHADRMKVPETYERKVESTLESLTREEAEKNQKKTFFGSMAFRLAALGLLIVISVALAAGTKSDANIFTNFRQTIMDFLNLGGSEKEEKPDVESVKESEQSKPDLMLEMRERVIDSNSIYLLVKITAPSNVKFNKEISFDYFCFSKGANYNPGKLLGGARSCSLLEVKPDKENEATYVVQISTDDKIKDGSMVTAYFKDLMIDPSGDKREMLVEGMWSISFEADYSVAGDIEVKGGKEQKYPFLGKTAFVDKIRITPLGMVIRSDVSQIPYDSLGVSDTSLKVRLKMLNGKEMLLMSHDAEEKTMVQSASSSYSQKGKKVYQKNRFEFEKTVNTSQILGVYIEDLYIPVMERED